MKSASAEVILQTGDVFIGNAYYDSSTDKYIANLDPNLISGGSVWHRLFNDESYTDMSHSSTHYYMSNPVWANATYTAGTDRWIWDIFYDSSGNIIGQIKIHGSEIKNPTYQTTYTPLLDGAPQPTNENCAAAVCECLSKLNDTTQQVNQSVNANGDKLVTINNSLQEVKSTVQSVGDSFLDELQTDTTVNNQPLPTVPTIDTPDLETDKPADKPSFQDDTVYFKDEGDTAEEPGPLPQGPDIKKWDGVDEKIDQVAEDVGSLDNVLSKDTEKSKEDEKAVDMELDSDVELIKETMKQDDMLTKDSFSKDSEMVKDESSQDDVLTKDSFQSTEQYESTNQQTKNNIYQQDDVMSVTE